MARPKKDAKKRMFDADLFKERLLAGIGDRSKAAFSRDAGIAPQRLSTLLNPSYTAVPEINTLKKLAAAMESENALYSLAEAAGYQPEELFSSDAARFMTGTEKRKHMSDDERNALGEKDIVDGLREMLKQSYSDIDEMMDDFRMLYASEEYTIEPGTAVPYKDDPLGIGLFAIPVIFSWTTIMTASIFPVAIIYMNDKAGKIMALNILFDAVSLKENGLLPENILNYLGDDDLSEYDTIHIIEDRRPGTGKEKMEALFGCLTSGDRNGYYITTVIGPGFKVGCMEDGGIRYLIDEEAVRVFFTIHHDTIASSPYYSHAYQDMVTNKMTIEEYRKRYDPLNADHGIYGVIADIMTSELGVSALVFDDPDENGEDNLPVIMIPEDEITDKSTVTNRSAVIAMGRYAKELGLPRYGRQYYTTRYSREDSDEFEVG